MANIGENAEIVNADELTLLVGVDTYIQLTDLNLHVEAVETRGATTGGVVYIYGRGNNWFTATLHATGPELSTLSALQIRSATGVLTPTVWLIKATPFTTGAKTFTCTGVLPKYDLRKGEDGFTDIDIFVRITGDTVAVT